MQPDAASLGLVSLIIPAHNASRTLGRSLNSASGQTFRKLEIIVVDDASTDDTGDIVRFHSASDPRIRLLRNETCLGVGGARNRGAAAASGGYFCFLDADDLLAPRAIEARLQTLQSTHADFCYAWCAQIDKDERILKYCTDELEPPNFFEDLVRRGNILQNGSCTLMTMEAFAAVGGYSEKLFQAGAQGCEDYKFYLDIARRAKVVCCRETLIGYRVTTTNMSSDTGRMVRSFELVQGEILYEFPHLKSALRACRDQYVFYCAVSVLKQGKVLEAMRLLGRIGARLPLLSGYLLGKVFDKTINNKAVPQKARFDYGQDPRAVG